MMKRSILFFVIFSLSISVFAQKKDKTLLTIDGKAIKVSEFKQVYEKNLNVIENEKDKNVINNLDLFINYKLKVKEAYRLKLDTIRSYKREMETYKNQLMAPYLQDKEYFNKLVKDSYFRTKNEVKARHILIRLPKHFTPQDTLKAYQKIITARKEILSGVSFDKVAKKYSEDPSAKRNGGDLGYFSAFKMVYPFENAAYNTKVGEVSMPFKTRFGYHIIQVDAIRPSRGKVAVAHILITDTTNVGKEKIEIVVKKLQEGISFEDLAKEYSNDIGSKNKGGKLDKFGTGRMLPSFEKVAFSLQKEGEVSKPFKTRFGWHLVKLIKKYPVGSFDEMKEELTKKVKSSGLGRLSDKAVLNKLKKKYVIISNKEAEKIIKTKNYRTLPKDSMQITLLTINGQKRTIKDFTNYSQNRRHKSTPILLEMFKDQEVINYYKDNLVNTEPEFAATLKEYEDGLLLFELMQRKIWSKSEKDTIGLKKYFKTHKENYKVKELDKIKGEVMNDYQTYLEKQWIAELRKKSQIKINKKQLKKLVKFYNKK